jgi:hypothetical protein
VWISQCAHAAIRHAVGVYHVKFVQPVIEVKKIVHKVGTDAKMERVCVRIACRSEFSGLQAHKSFGLRLVVISPDEEPSFGCTRDIIAVRVQSQGVGTVRHEIWEQEFFLRVGEQHGSDVPRQITGRWYEQHEDFIVAGVFDRLERRWNFCRSENNGDMMKKCGPEERRPRLQPRSPDTD